MSKSSTTKRMVMIDTQGMMGKKVEYKSIPWGCVQAFALQSAAAWFDKDSEMMLWTDIFYTYETEKVTEGEGDEQGEGLGAAYQLEVREHAQRWMCSTFNGYDCRCEKLDREQTVTLLQIVDAEGAAAWGGDGAASRLRPVLRQDLDELVKVKVSVAIGVKPVKQGSGLLE